MIDPYMVDPTLTSIRNAFISLIILGTIARIIYCMIQMTHSEDGHVYKKRAIYAIIFLVLAFSISAIAMLVQYYYN